MTLPEWRERFYNLKLQDRFDFFREAALGFEEYARFLMVTEHKIPIVQVGDHDLWSYHCSEASYRIRQERFAKALDDYDRHLLAKPADHQPTCW